MGNLPTLPLKAVAAIVAAAAVCLTALGWASPARSAAVSAAAKVAQPAHVDDPLQGPNAIADALHSHDVLHLTPAVGPPQPLLRPRLPLNVAAMSGVGAGPVELGVSPALGAREGLAISGGTLQREVMGFAPYWSLSDYANWDYSRMSTVAYFGLTIKWDGSWNATDSGMNAWNSQAFANMVNRAHAAGDRVVVVVKQFNEASIWDIVGNASIEQTAITNIIGAIAYRNIDGVNIDFEGHEDPVNYPSIQPALVNFMTMLSTQVHQRWPSGFVSIDTYSGAASWDGGFFNIGQLAPVVDAMFVMAYDMSFSDVGYGRAGPNAPLNGWTFNDTTSMTEYLTKAPASKVILGVPYYGYKWSVRSPQAYAPAVGGATATSYSQVLQDLACAQRLTRAWDSTAQSPWATWWSPAANDPCGANLNSWRELYYDDTSSLGIKYDLVNSMNLRGMGMWALGYDGDAPELWNEIDLKFAAHWESLGGALTSGAEVASWSPNRLDVFARGADNALYHRAWTGRGWSGWESLGGSLTSDPAAVSWGNGRIDVFARGVDNALYHKVYSGSWSAWEALGGALASGPAVASWGPGRLDVFVQGNDNAVYHRAYSGSWGGWESLGGALTSDPTAVSWGSGRIDVFARGTDNALYHRVWNGNGWGGWESLGATLGSAPTSASWAPNRLDVFALAPDNSLMHRTWTGYVWTGWENWGGSWSADPAAVSWGIGRLDIFERGSDNALWHFGFQFV